MNFVFVSTDRIQCHRCGREIGTVSTEYGVEIRATCATCAPSPEVVLRFAAALRRALKFSELKIEYVARRLQITTRTLRRWVEARRFRPPYEYREKLRLLFHGTKGYDAIMEELSTWHKADI